MELLNKHQAKHVHNLAARLKSIPMFEAGDTLAVHIKVREGQRERTQVFEGMCLARRNRGIGSSFLVRKVSYGEGVERTFPLYSPSIARIKILKKGKVRRAKLYYLRELSGKKARIASTIASADDVIDVTSPDVAAPKEKAKEKVKTAEAKTESSKQETKEESKTETEKEAKTEVKPEEAKQPEPQPQPKEASQPAQNNEPAKK